jgi:hypothetical protein
MSREVQGKIDSDFTDADIIPQAPIGHSSTFRKLPRPPISACSSVRGTELLLNNGDYTLRGVPGRRSTTRNRRPQKFV